MVAGGQRRRRVLIEEKRSEQGGEGASGRRARDQRVRGASDAERRSYTEAAEARFQPSSVALLAVRGWTLTMAALLAVCILAGLQLAYAHLQFRTVGWIPSEIPALDLGQRANLASWFSSLLLVAAAFEAAQIYRLRRHKVDDYRGRYRMWVWVPAVLSLMAMCTASGLHRDAISWLNQWTEGVGAVPASLFAPLALCLAWTLICLRLGVEIRSSRGALLLLALGTICYFAVALLQVLRPLPTGPLVQVMLHSSLGYLGHLGVGMAVATYGRYVYLDAQGRLSHRSKRTVAAKESAEGQADAGATAKAEPRQSSAAKTSGETAAAAEEPRSAAAKEPGAPRVAGSVKPSQDNDYEADDGLDEEKLSKSERRRLRKQKRRDQQRRAA
jgi:hypothetical protein